MKGICAVANRRHGNSRKMMSSPIDTATFHRQPTTVDLAHFHIKIALIEIRSISYTRPGTIVRENNREKVFESL